MPEPSEVLKICEKIRYHPGVSGLRVCLDSCLLCTAEVTLYGNLLCTEYLVCVSSIYHLSGSSDRIFFFFFSQVGHADKKKLNTLHYIGKLFSFMGT